jgi:HK97 family phage major capsid protein
LGYPVNLCEALPSTEANSQVCALFGDLSQAAAFGSRRGMTIGTSDSTTLPGDSNSVFATDEVAMRATQRFDILVHDIGTATVAGPVVGLQTLNS